MTDPFTLTGPAVVSVSGGRTSALMLRRILDAHGGRLPRDVHAVYALSPSTSHSTVHPRARASRTAVSASTAAWRPLSSNEIVACDTLLSGVLAASASSRIERSRALRRSRIRSPSGVGAASFGGFRATTTGTAMLSMRRAYVKPREWLVWQPFLVARAPEAVRLATMKRLGTLEDRFWSRVQKTDGCWLWLWSRNEFGYGVIGVAGRSKRAHRLSWEMVNGPIPDGMVVCHHCDNPACVNPEHLFVGTHADNVADKMSKGRCPRGETAGPARLTDAQTEEIRARRTRGESCRSIASFFGVAVSTVSGIVNNRRRADPSIPTPPIGRRGQKITRSNTEKTTP